MRKLLSKRHFHIAGFVVFAAWCGISGANAADQPEHLASFDPAKGFKPAQRDLTEIFLELAGSLEASGSPEPFLRHVAAEHTRIENLYRQKFGTEPRSYRPAYMTDAYIDKLSANWKILSPKLGLDAYARDFGHMMRDAIKGTRGNGTIIIEIFNQHQTRVFDEMAGKSKGSADFEALRKELIDRLELNNTGVDDTGFAIARRDAVTFALGIHGVTMKLFKRLDEGLKPADAERVKAALLSVIMDTGRMAQSELEAGISEWALGQSAQPATNLAAYDASREPRLTGAERKQLSSLLAKQQFSKSDFAALDAFYKTAYDRLSEEGKDQMSKRLWNGMRR